MEGFVPSIRVKCGDVICDIRISEVDDRVRVEVGNRLIEAKAQEGEERHDDLRINFSGSCDFLMPENRQNHRRFVKIKKILSHFYHDVNIDHRVQGCSSI